MITLNRLYKIILLLQLLGYVYIKKLQFTYLIMLFYLNKQVLKMLCYKVIIIVVVLFIIYKIMQLQIFTIFRLTFSRDELALKVEKKNNGFTGLLTHSYKKCIHCERSGFSWWLTMLKVIFNE